MCSQKLDLFRSLWKSLAIKSSSRLPSCSGHRVFPCWRFLDAKKSLQSDAGWWCVRSCAGCVGTADLLFLLAELSALVWSFACIGPLSQSCSLRSFVYWAPATNIGAKLSTAASPILRRYRSCYDMASAAVSASVLVALDLLFWCQTSEP